MIECLLTSALLVAGLFTNNSDCFITAGLFAIACNLNVIAGEE